MCLESLTSCIDMKIYTGYQAMIFRNGLYYPLYMYGVGVSITSPLFECAKGPIIDTNSDSDSYPAGFHIFRTKAPAIRVGVGHYLLNVLRPGESVRLVKMQYKCILAKGYNHVYKHSRARCDVALYRKCIADMGDCRILGKSYL